MFMNDLSYRAYQIPQAMLARSAAATGRLFSEQATTCGQGQIPAR